MRSFEQYDEIVKYFGEGKNRNVVSGEVQHDLNLHDMTPAKFYDIQFAMWLDFRTIDENELHGSGRRVNKTSERVTVQVEKEAESAGNLKAYVYLIMDAQLNIRDGKYDSILY